MDKQQIIIAFDTAKSAVLAHLNNKIQLAELQELDKKLQSQKAVEMDNLNSLLKEI